MVTTSITSAAKQDPSKVNPPKWVKEFVETILDEGHKLSLTELGYIPELKEVSKYEILSYREEKNKNYARVRCTVTALRTYDEATHEYKVAKLAKVQEEETEFVFSKKGKKVMLYSNPPSYVLAKKK